MLTPPSIKRPIRQPAARSLSTPASPTAPTKINPEIPALIIFQLEQPRRFSLVAGILLSTRIRCSHLTSLPGTRTPVSRPHCRTRGSGTRRPSEATHNARVCGGGTAATQSIRCHSIVTPKGGLRHAVPRLRPVRSRGLSRRPTYTATTTLGSPRTTPARTTAGSYARRANTRSTIGAKSSSGSDA